MDDAQIDKIADQVTLLSGITDTDFLTQFIPVLVEAMNVYCNRKLNLQAAEDKFRSVPHMREQFFLRQFPVATITAITEDGVTLVADTDFELEPESGKLTRLSNNFPCIWKGQCIIRATYTAGYDPFPQDLVLVLSNILTHQWGKKAQQDLGNGDLAGVAKMTLFDVGSIETTDVSEFQSDAQDVHPLLGNYVTVLDHYRVPAGSGARAPHAVSWLT